MDKNMLMAIEQKARQFAVSAEHIKSSDEASRLVSDAFGLIIGLCKALKKKE